MRNLSLVLCINTLVFLFGVETQAQYTDVINSNRPGLSVSAYAVGSNVLQIESGFSFEQRDHALLNYESGIAGVDLALRYGLFFEPLEITYEGTFQNQHITYLTYNDTRNLTDFSRNRVGLKYLLYDRYKNEKPNLYSWRANNVFQFKNLIPSVSLYGGTTFALGDNPFYPNDPTVMFRGMAATQSRLTPRMVLITNWIYDRITSDDPELSYLISLSYAFRNPKWSAFVENQGIKSDRYADVLLRSGVAFLAAENLQVDMLLGASFKDTPSRIFISFGGSYRFDWHRDKPIKAIEDQEGGENGEIEKPKKRKKDKNQRGAEDVDLGPTKKQLRKMKREEKKKKKNKNNEIEF